MTSLSKQVRPRDRVLMFPEEQTNRTAKRDKQRDTGGHQLCMETFKQYAAHMHQETVERLSEALE